MLKPLLAAAVVLSATLLNGCSTPNLTGRPFFNGLEAPRAGQATLYFYRLRPTIGASETPKIAINGETAGELPSGSYFVPHLPAGRHHITSTTAPLVSSLSNSSFDLQVESGKFYFIADQEDTSPYKDDGKTLSRVSKASLGPTMYYFRYALVSQDEALRSLKWCQERPPAR